MHKSVKIGVVLAVVLAATACEDVGLSPNESLNNDDIAELALASDLLEGNLLFAQIGGLVAGADGAQAAADAPEPDGTREFHRERACPEGGLISVDGIIEKVTHGEGVVEFFIQGRGVHDECSFQRRRFLLTLNGEFTLDAYRKLVNHEPVGPQTTTKVGWFDYVKTNAEGVEVDRGHCEYDITSVWNPESGKRTVTGIFCGREVDRTVDWQR